MRLLSLPVILFMVACVGVLLAFIEAMLPDDAQGWIVPTGKALFTTAALAVVARTWLTLRSV